jgi:hypothetical protein
LTRSIVDRGSVALSGNLLGSAAHQGQDGRYYSPFGIAQSVYNVPFYVAAKVVVAASGIRIGKEDSLLKAAVALGETLIGAMLVVIVFRFGCDVTGDPHAAALGSLWLAFGTVLWPYAGFGFNQPLGAAAMIAGIFAAYRGLARARRGALVIAGVWMAVALLTRHELALAVLPIAAWILLRRQPPWADRWKQLAAFAAGPAVGTVIWLVYNAVRFGNPFDAGYLRDTVPQFGSPILEGLAGLLVSPSTSIFLYSPPVLLGVAGVRWVWRRDAPLGRVLAGTCVLFALFYACLGNWTGGRSYGSRYLLILLPVLAIGWMTWLSALGPRVRRWAFVVVLAVSAVVQLPGVMVDYAKVSQAATAGRARPTSEERKWSWDVAPLVLNTHALVEVFPANAAYLAGTRTPPAVAPPTGDEDRGFSQQFAFSLNFWWCYLFYLGALPRLAVWSLALGFMICVITVSRRLSAQLADTAPAGQ